MRYIRTLGFSVYSAKIRAKAQKMHKWLILYLFIITISANDAFAMVPCHGRFVNPITDICWSCILPISIGSISTGKSLSPKKRDTPNPASPICGCMKGGVPIPGLAIGFWEPLRLVDITTVPYCMTNLGGVSIGSDPKRVSAHSRGYNKRQQHSSFYHVHYYIYPLIYWLELLTDFACLESLSFDVAYMSEFDITWNDPKIQSLLNPEAILFGNPIAQAACALDCGASSFNLPLDSLFWCAGCWGNLYPFSGANADHVGGVQNSSLLTARILAKMHRIGLAQNTTTTNASFDGPLCRKRLAPLFKKSQYKLQMTYPQSSSGAIGCWPIGMSDLSYSTLKEYPYNGQDWGYLIWRKTNCCFL